MSNYIYGIHPVMEALSSGKKIEKVLLKQGFEGPQSRALTALLKEKEVPYSWVPAQRLNSMVNGAHQGGGGLYLSGGLCAVRGDGGECP